MNNVLKSKIIPLFSCQFFNVDSSFNIKDRKLKFPVVVIGIIMEGNESQLFYLGPSFCFMSP